jgi:predicted PurR-regulated permease PerM
MAGTARLNTLVLLVSLLGGVTAFGFIGIVLGPVVAALFTALVGSYLLSPSPAAEVAAGEPAAGAPPGGEA